MEGFELWFYRGALAVFFAILYFLFQKWIGRIDKRFDELIEAVNDISKSLVRQSVEIGNLTKRVDSNDKRLYDHSRRLRNMENKQAGCLNYKKKQ